MSIAELTSKAKADLIMAKVLRGKDVAEALNKAFEQQDMIAGHSAEYWREHFKINIPTDNMTPQLAVEVNLKLLQLYQEASFYYAWAQKKKEHMRCGVETAKAQTINGLVEEFKIKNKKVPAATILEALAKSDAEDLDQASEIYKTEYNFWKQMLDQLTTVFKMVQNASTAIAVEAKYELNLDRIQYNSKGDRNDGRS